MRQCEFRLARLAGPPSEDFWTFSHGLNTLVHLLIVTCLDDLFISKNSISEQQQHVPPTSTYTNSAAVWLSPTFERGTLLIRLSIASVSPHDQRWFVVEAIFAKTKFGFPGHHCRNFIWKHTAEYKRAILRNAHIITHELGDSVRYRFAVTITCQSESPLPMNQKCGCQWVKVHPLMMSLPSIYVCMYACMYECMLVWM